MDFNRVESLGEDFADHFGGTVFYPVKNECMFLPEDTLDGLVLVNAEALGTFPSSETNHFMDSEDEVLNIVNSSLPVSMFPDAFKTAVVKQFRS